MTDDMTDLVAEEVGRETPLSERIEAILLIIDEPIGLVALAAAVGSPVAAVRQTIETLVDDYDGRGQGPRRGFELREVGGGWRIYVRTEFDAVVADFVTAQNPSKLSQAALETLAVIAYKQPITAAEITEIRGVNTSGVLSTLLERHLIKIVGRKNVVGRPFLYATTKEFLIRFGLNNLNDLPKVEDMAEALGFDPPAGLMEQTPAEDVLPLDEETPPDSSEA